MRLGLGLAIWKGSERKEKGNGRKAWEEDV